MSNQKGIILTITLIFVIVLVIIAGVSILLMTNQARITEYQIKRIRAFYTAEAAQTFVLEQVRTGAMSPPAGPDTMPDILPSLVNGYNANVTWGAPNSGPNDTRTLNLTVVY